MCHLQLYLLIVIVCLTSPSLFSAECHFPEHWSGVWFQRGVRELVNISFANIGSKGVCKSVKDNKYIVEDKLEKCVRCLVINEPHSNLLRFKETNRCYPTSQWKNNNLDICFDITGDAPLYYLFRVNGPPINCPFNGTFSFSYAKGLNECKDPLSRIEDCVDEQHLLLRYKACADVRGSERRDVEMECVAEWKEGQFKYFIGKLKYNYPSSYEHQFRCFIVEKDVTSSIDRYDVGQSGDASCDGLYSPRDGWKTMKVTQTTSPTTLCNFPEWMTTNKRWKTLDNQMFFDFIESNSLNVYDRRRETLRKLKCIRSIQRSAAVNSTRVVVSIKQGCKLSYVCMQVHQRDDRIIEVQFGEPSPFDVGAACGDHLFNPTTARYMVLTTLDDITKGCPFRGMFTLTANVTVMQMFSHQVEYDQLIPFVYHQAQCEPGSLSLRSGCSDDDLFQVSCQHSTTSMDYKCRGGWSEDTNIEHVLVSFIDRFEYEYCLTFDTTSGEVMLTRIGGNNNNFDCYHRTHRSVASKYDMLSLVATTKNENCGDLTDWSVPIVPSTSLVFIFFANILLHSFSNANPLASVP